jgi:hypothetical protein
MFIVIILKMTYQGFIQNYQKLEMAVTINIST